MFCTRCGTPNPDDASFCRNCSATLTKPGASPRPTSSSGSSTSPHYQPPTIASRPQPPPEQAPYPGYQGFPIQQNEYIRPSAVPQGGASGRAIAAMVLSILSLFTCGPLMSIPGAILGKMEMNAIRNGQASAAGETFAKVGFYLGLGVTVLSCLGGIVWALLSFMGMAVGIN